jgi:hypothetical protein
MDKKIDRADSAWLAQTEGDFEKGEAGGAKATLAVVSAAARGESAEGCGVNRFLRPCHKPPRQSARCNGFATFPRGASFLLVGDSEKPS